jgi:L-lactate dehydrogenase complex protein LldF
MRIPLPKMMRHWREREFERGLNPVTQRFGLKFWAWFAKRPGFYRTASAIGIPLLSLLGGRKRRFRFLPLAGGWTKWRDLPAPESRTFMQQWRDRGGAAREAAR